MTDQQVTPHFGLKPYCGKSWAMISSKRAPDEIATILTHKLRFAEDLDELEKYLPVVAGIVALRGEPSDVTARLRAQWAAGNLPEAFIETESLCALVAAELPAQQPTQCL